MSVFPTLFKYRGDNAYVLTGYLLFTLFYFILVELLTLCPDWDSNLDHLD